MPLRLHYALTLQLNNKTQIKLIWETNLMVHMHWFVSPISQTQPRHLPSARSTVYIFSDSYFFDLRRHFSISDTTNNAHCSIHYHTNTCRWFWSGRWWCGSVPKRASAGSMSEARGWPSATGWLQRRRHWASTETERDRNTALSQCLFRWRSQLTGVHDHSEISNAKRNPWMSHNPHLPS
jgi:hypothetical protein